MNTLHQSSLEASSGQLMQTSDERHCSTDKSDGEAKANANNGSTYRLAQLLHQGHTSAYFATHDPPEIDWIVEGVLESNGTAMIYGDSGIGKTFLALHLACCIGSGRRWFKCRTRKSKVLYLDGENGDGLMHRRSRMIDPEGEADVTYFSFPAVSLEVDGQLLIASLVEALHADVVVIDPLMNFMEGDENSIEDIRPQLRGLRAMADNLDVAIVLIHHENRQGGYRGSSGFKDLVTLQLHIKESRTDVPDYPHALDILPKKQRQSTLERFTLAWRVEDGEFTAGTIAMIKNGPSTKIINACQQLRADNGEWPGKTELIRAKDQHGLSRSEARQALDAALSNNDIQVHPGKHNKHEFRVPRSDLDNLMP